MSTDHLHRCKQCGRTWSCPGDCHTAAGRCLTCGALPIDWERFVAESIDYRDQRGGGGNPAYAFKVGSWTSASGRHDAILGPCRCGAWHEAGDIEKAGGRLDS